MAKSNPYSVWWFFPWLIAITLLCGLIFVIAQQTVRLSTNMQLVQNSQDIAHNIMAQESIPTNFPPQKVDMGSSLGIFFFIYDKDKKLVGTTATLNGQTPEIPLGVLAFAKDKGEDRVTWQPKKGIRNAIAVTYFKGKSEGYVVTGRSLREVEKLEDTLQTLAGVGWIATLALTFFAGVLVRAFRK